MDDSVGPVDVQVHRAYRRSLRISFAADLDRNRGPAARDDKSLEA